MVSSGGVLTITIIVLSCATLSLWTTLHRKSEISANTDAVYSASFYKVSFTKAKAKEKANHGLMLTLLQTLRIQEMIWEYVFLQSQEFYFSTNISNFQNANSQKE